MLTEFLSQPSPGDWVVCNEPSHSALLFEPSVLRSEPIDWPDLVKRLAVKFHLIPGSLEARAYLKRIFMGKLVPLPSEITEDMIDYEPPIEIPIDKVTKDFKILYAIGKK